MVGKSGELCSFVANTDSARRVFGELPFFAQPEILQKKINAKPNSMNISGEKTTLIPARPEHRQLCFEWATRSDATPFWYGERYGDEIPDETAFFGDWQSHYFEEEIPERGRLFLIEAAGELVGMVNYNSLNDEELDLDILIASDNNKGRGYGSDALKTLTDFLHRNYSISDFQIHAIADNFRAIRAYEKAGFSTSEIYRDERGLEWRKMVLNLV